MSGHMTQSPGLAVVMPFYFVFWQMKPVEFSQVSVVLMKIVELQTAIFQQDTQQCNVNSVCGSRTYVVFALCVIASSQCFCLWLIKWRRHLQ
jgi:hypothetical protein